MRDLPMQALYRGQPCQTTLSVAWSNSGEMQIELIHQSDDTPSLFTEFLAAQGPGFHQLAYWTTDFAATMREVEKAGWPVVWSGGEGYGVRFAYVEPPDAPAAVIEISELTDATAANAISCMTPLWNGTAATRSGCSAPSVGWTVAVPQTV
jgi:Glyoxalase/Bleomycin resistance protein/Dioxygenase superfamily